MVIKEVGQDSMLLFDQYKMIFILIQIEMKFTLKDIPKYIETVYSNYNDKIKEYTFPIKNWLRYFSRRVS